MSHVIIELFIISCMPPDPKSEMCKKKKKLVLQYRGSQWQLFKRNVSNFSQLYHAENMLDFDERMNILCTQPTCLVFYCASSQKQYYACRYVPTHWHITLIPSRQVFALTPCFNAVCPSEKQQIPIYSLLFPKQLLETKQMLKGHVNGHELRNSRNAKYLKKRLIEYNMYIYII